MGVAFGGAATDALFGAGAGNAITKLTKWCAVFFFVLSLGLAVADTHYARADREAITRQMLTVESAAAPLDADKAKATTLGAPVPTTETAPVADVTESLSAEEEATDAGEPVEAD